MVLAETTPPTALVAHPTVGESDDRHVCLIYESDPAEQYPAILPFIREGLDGGERCIYVADDSRIDDLTAAMRAAGIDANAALVRGALLIWTRDEWRHAGPLDSVAGAAQVRAAIADALVAGYPAVRFAVEMTWTLDPDIPADALRHWEATINTVFTSDLPGRITCQYNRGRLGAAMLHAALSTHPVAVLGGAVCPNPYYEAPLLLDGELPPALEPTPARVGWMLSQLRLNRALADERERRARAEAALEESNRSRARIQELYDVAEQRTADLQEALAAKDEFLGLLSHELKTPLTMIRGNAEILRRTNAGGIDPADRELALADIEQEAERLHRMIDNLLVLARLERDGRPETEPALVRRIIAGLVAEHRRNHSGRRVDVVIRAPITPVLIHRDYLEQVLRNLLSNAEKYAPASTPIEVRMSRNAHALIVSVLDHGPGVPRDERERVFSPFYRSPRTADRTPGVGIGLVVCRRLMEAQGGSIAVTQRRGGGACFTLRLPAESALDPDA